MNQEHLIQQIERLALHTWPAETQTPLGDWLLRASGGISKRGNSVWTSNQTVPEHVEWLSEAESFYHNRGLPLRFHISDASPKELTSLLDHRNYIKEVPCSVMIAEVDQVIKNTSNIHSLCSYQIQSEPDEKWINHFMQMEEHEAWKRSFYERLLESIQPIKGFITLYCGNEAVAVGTSVIEEGWAGFINIAVKPAHRGKGIGKELLHYLSIWSAEQTASRLYLQVIDTNEPALKLYQRAGYISLFSYHYRCES